MYTTCIIWLAFMPLFFGTGNNFEVIAVLSLIGVHRRTPRVLACVGCAYWS